MAEQKERILALKDKRDQDGLSVQNIYDLVEKHGSHLSKSSIARVFQNKSEEQGFRNDTIKILEDSLSDAKSIEREKLKALELNYKKEIDGYKSEISELKHKLEREKQRSEEKIEKERDQFNTRIEQLNTHINFLSEQIKLKDKRMDEKDRRFDRLFERFDKKEDNFDNLAQQFFTRCSNCQLKK